jgi:hypothetical protein
VHKRRRFSSLAKVWADYLFLSTQVEKSDYKKKPEPKILENIFFAIIIRLLLYIKNGSQTEKKHESKRLLFLTNRRD